MRLLYSFTTEENVCLVMEYLPGGDLYSLLKSLGRLDEPVARGCALLQTGLPLHHTPFALSTPCPSRSAAWTSRSPAGALGVCVWCKVVSPYAPHPLYSLLKSLGRLDEPIARGCALW